MREATHSQEFPRPIVFALRTIGSRLLLWTLRIILLIYACSFSSTARDIGALQSNTALHHGLWVWKGPSVVESPNGAELLRDFCRSNGINEIYISVSAHGDVSPDNRFAHLIDLLHRSNIRVEALLSSENADEPGKHREKLLDHIRAVLQFNRSHSANRFDGIHLDIEPQQRPRTKAPAISVSCRASWTLIVLRAP